MTEQLQISAQPEDNPIVLRRKQMNLDAGWLGHVFGSKGNAPVNIAGLFVILLILIGGGSLFWETRIPASDIWQTIVPLVTLVMGYLFGKG